MLSVLELVGCILFVFCLFLTAIKITVGAVKIFYKVAPWVVFAGFAAGFLYFLGAQ
jgi:hypothetical protein